MRLPGAAGQVNSGENMFDASGTITTGGTAQLLLPRVPSRSSLIIQNISDTNMTIEIGGARASATLTSGGVSSVAVTNAGLNYTKAPTVHFYGGGFSNSQQSTPTFTFPAVPNMYSPVSVAKAHCVMTGSAGSMTVSSIVVDSPGSGYAYPPYVFLRNDDSDPFGAAVPSASSGILLLANGGSYNPNGTITTTDQISIFCSGSSKAFVCKFTI